MLTASRRRNGAKPSCEPCRTSKIRCDHQKPTCGSCRRRGLSAKCWYHPAPLTKQRRGECVSSPPFSLLEPQPAEQNELGIGRGNPLPGPHISTCEPLSRSDAWPFTGSLGATSQTALHVDIAVEAPSTKELLPVIKQIISPMRYFEDIKDHLDFYIASSQVALVPRPLIRQLVTSMETFPIFSAHVNDILEDSDAISRIAECVLHNASSDITVDPSLNMQGFGSLFCGQNLRVESLGILYTIATRAALYRGDKTIDANYQLIEQLVQCSSRILRLARDLDTQPNDVMIWLAYENLQLTTLIKGHSNHSVWHKLCDLATDVFSLGLHREETYSASKIPIFLAEYRRKAFVVAYHIDKAFAVVFDRPPRISTRHATCKPPLEISDDALFATEPAVWQEHQSQLTPQGWNIDGRYRTTTWARIRYIIAQFREELIEHTFKARSQANGDELRDLLQRFQGAWNSLPSHLYLNQTVWPPDLPTEISLMLRKMKLLYLHTQLEIWQLLDESAETHSPELVTVAAQMLETVIAVSNARDKNDFYCRDLPATILMYGVPCAAILTSRLQNTSPRHGARLPPEIKRSLVIRNLSVLVSCLETATGPNDANHESCVQASKAIASVLDVVLDNHPQQVTSTVGNAFQTTEAQPLAVSNYGTTEVEHAAFSEFPAFDYDAWTTSIDFGTVDSQGLF